MASFKEFFLGKPEKTQSFSTLSPGSQNLQSQLTGGLQGPLAAALQSIMGTLQGSPQSYEAFEKPLMRQFQEQIIPGLAEGFGGLGATSSSGAQQTFARAGTDLMERLGAQRAGLQQQSIGNILQLLGLGLNPSQQTYIRPETGGLIGSGSETVLKLLPLLALL